MNEEDAPKVVAIVAVSVALGVTIAAFKKTRELISKNKKEEEAKKQYFSYLYALKYVLAKDAAEGYAEAEEKSADVDHEFVGIIAYNYFD
jgi:hypothetical protein